ncbi:MAG TPA: recombinase family protein, partial [Solirubrobacteraceae bacterium]|nr:recombinase family protein [Solirubrobacteraceae bacterium]
MGLPFAGIVRVSSMAGRKSGASDFHSESDQRDTILASGHNVVMLPSELDVSGGSAIEDRPALLEAVEGVEAGKYAGVIVAYLSRLGRSVRHQLAAWDRIEAAGGKVVVVQEGIDTSTPTGRLYRTIMLGIAEHERDLHVERFADLRQHATEAGIWQRRQTPTGYSRDPRTRKLVPNADADRVRLAFERRAAGVPLRTIAEQDLQMTPRGVSLLLRNRVYLGELKVGQHVNTAAHPSLVTVEQFEAAQVEQPRPPRSNTHEGPALLAGIARCATCGYVLGRGSGVVKGKRYIYYRCPV